MSRVQFILLEFGIEAVVMIDLILCNIMQIIRAVYCSEVKTINVVLIYYIMRKYSDVIWSEKAEYLTLSFWRKKES